MLLKRNGFCTFFAWFLIETVFDWDCSSKVWSKSHRSVLARFTQCDIPLSLVSLDSSLDRGYEWSFCANLSSSMHFLLGPAKFELRFTIYVVSKKNDREFLRNVLPDSWLFYGISSTRWRRWSTLSVLQFCRVERPSLLDFLLHSLSTKKCPQVQ